MTSGVKRLTTPPRARLVRSLAVWGAVITSGACASLPPRTTQACVAADQTLTQELMGLTTIQAMPGGCASGTWAADCQQHTERLRRLAGTCQTHVPTLMANAAISYDAREFQRAQDYLNAIFSLRAVAPDAAALRARLALDEGNLPFALRFTSEQIALSPDHAGLREVRAAALFGAGRLTEASAELVTAERLGAPAWRVAFDRGLIAEASGQPAEAIRHFETALNARPGWSAAQGRIRGLRAATGG